MPKMNARLQRFLKPVLGAIGLLIIVLWSLGVFHKQVGAGTVAHEPGFALPQGAALHTVQLTTNAARIDVVGTVRSERLIHLSARLSAYIKDVFVSAGSRVKQGQTLMTLDDREIQEQLAAAEAQLAQAETEYQRAKQLFDSKATTEQALQAAESAARAAKAQVERVKVMLTYAQVVSPLDGIVTERRIEAGDLAGPGQVLLAVYDPLHMRLESPVPVRLVHRLALQQEVDVELNYPERSFKGHVTEIVSEIDPQSRTQLVRVSLENPANDVLPGTYGKLWVDDEPHPTILIPATAVVRVGQLELVQVVRKGRVVRQLVKTGPARDGLVEILSGLAAGDPVLVHPVKEG